MSYLIIFTSIHIFCMIASLFISSHIDDELTVLWSIMFGPIALIYYSVVVFGENREICICMICEERRSEYRFHCCKKCIKKYDIKNKHEISYYQREREILSTIAKEKVEMRIQVMEDLYSGGSDEDAKNQETIFRRKE